MYSSSMTQPQDHRMRPGYEIRVRGTKYLWGSAGLTHNMTFLRPPIMHVHNDLVGEVITVGTHLAAGTETTLGTLGPGECLSIQLQGIAGVFATCASESTVTCHIH